MVEINRILCPVDLSEFSRHALDHALALARWYDAHVTVLYVSGVPPLPVPLTGMPADVPVLPPLQPDVVAEDVRRFCGPLPTAPGGPAAIVVKEGNAAKEIIYEAERADLVVMEASGALDATVVSPVPGERGPLAVERAGVQPRESLAAAGATGADRHLVADSLRQRLVKTGGRLVKHARYYWLVLAESHLTRRLFGSMLQRIWALPVPTG